METEPLHQLHAKVLDGDPAAMAQWCALPYTPEGRIWPTLWQQAPSAWMTPHDAMLIRTCHLGQAICTGILMHQADPRALDEGLLAAIGSNHIACLDMLMRHPRPFRVDMITMATRRAQAAHQHDMVAILLDQETSPSVHLALLAAAQGHADLVQQLAHLWGMARLVRETELAVRNKEGTGAERIGARHVDALAHLLPLNEDHLRCLGHLFAPHNLPRIHAKLQAIMLDHGLPMPSSYRPSKARL